MQKKIIAAIIAVSILLTVPAGAYAQPKLALNPANHQNPGAINGYTEAAGMIDVARRAKVAAERQGIPSEIFWSGFRQGGGVSSLKQEVAGANSYDPSLFMAMHSDGVPKSRGIFVLYKDEEGKRAGEIIGDHIAWKMGLKFEGVSHRPGLLVLRQSKAPAILIEYLSHADLGDNRKLDDPNYREQLATATVEGYAKYAGYPIDPSKFVINEKPEPQPEPEAKPAENPNDGDTVKAAKAVEATAEKVIQKSDSKSGTETKVKILTKETEKELKSIQKDVDSMNIPGIVGSGITVGINYLKMSTGIIW